MLNAVVLMGTLLAADPAAVVSAATRDDSGFLIHEVASPFQSGPTQIRVLLPDDVEQFRHLPVVYVLPVEAQRESRYGDGLLEVKNLNLHNLRRAIFVTPTFSRLPWYADHPTDAALRQETHLLRAVVPFIERTYPARGARDGRLLLGFSKSGWGAWSLLLRHPDVFERAAAWDAPLMMDAPGKYGSGDIFGTEENFAKYRITDLLRARSRAWDDPQRLILLGYGNFRSEHQRLHQLLEELQLPHQYQDGPDRKHVWHSGWLIDAVTALLAPRSD